MLSHRCVIAYDLSNDDREKNVHYILDTQTVSRRCEFAYDLSNASSSVCHTPDKYGIRIDDIHTLCRVLVFRFCSWIHWRNRHNGIDTVWHEPADVFWGLITHWTVSGIVRIDMAVHRCECAYVWWDDLFWRQEYWQMLHLWRFDSFIAAGLALLATAVFSFWSFADRLAIGLLDDEALSFCELIPRLADMISLVNFFCTKAEPATIESVCINLERVGMNRISDVFVWKMGCFHCKLPVDRSRLFSKCGHFIRFGIHLLLAIPVITILINRFVWFLLQTNVEVFFIAWIDDLNNCFRFARSLFTQTIQMIRLFFRLNCIGMQKPVKIIPVKTYRKSPRINSPKPKPRDCLLPFSLFATPIGNNWSSISNFEYADATLEIIEKEEKNHHLTNQFIDNELKTLRPIFTCRLSFAEKIVWTFAKLLRNSAQRNRHLARDNR